MMQRREAGFSLLEIMFAILVLGIALVGLTTGISAALGSSKESELQTTAAMLAAGQIELLRADSVVVDGEQEGSGGSGLEIYKWKQTVTATDIRGLHEVSVVISHSKTGAEIYELKTMLFSTPSESSEDDAAKKKADSRKNRRRGQ